METTHSLPLNECHVQKTWANLNKTYTPIHILALSVIFYYRTSFFLNKNDPKYYNISFLPWLTVFAAELLLSFTWFLKQPGSWRPVTRTVYPERLPTDDELPGIDVFICTADPEKEPTWEVINTVLSAMALDYPVEKLSVYLSDDGGAFVTLKGMKLGWIFASWWLPFCRKYNVKTICPRAYFEEEAQESQSQEFIHDKEIVKEKYEAFKQQMGRKMIKGDEVDANRNARDHPSLVQVIDANTIENEYGEALKPEQRKMPLLVYVAREKRPSHHHNFKAGALNVLLRVSSIMSNSPYALILDCDMYCNDSISARQAMCFHLDTKISPSLAWVQYPHKFHNVNEIDIYDSQMRAAWSIFYPGTDGIKGPVLSGTNFYIKKEALFDTKDDHVGNDLRRLKEYFGSSNEFISSLIHIYKNTAGKDREVSSVLLQEAEFLASCTYEIGTKWGEKVGIRYGSVIEDVKTSFALQSKGWRSVYLNPPRPQFLGSATTTLNDLLIQGLRWISGLLGIGLSTHCPLIYRPSKMTPLQKISSSSIVLYPLAFLPLLTFATILPLCFLYGIPLYPKASDPFLVSFAFVFAMSNLKHLCEFLKSGGSIKAWLNEQQTLMMKVATSYAYGFLHCLMTIFNLREETFVPTNKGGDEDRRKYYEIGKYDFRTSNMFLIPLGTLAILNLACFVGGLVRVIVARNLDAMFAQMLFSLYLLVISFVVIQAMFFRNDSGRFPSSATFISIVLCFLVWGLLCYVI